MKRSIKESRRYAFFARGHWTDAWFAMTMFAMGGFSIFGPFLALLDRNAGAPRMDEAAHGIFAIMVGILATIAGVLIGAILFFGWLAFCFGFGMSIWKKPPPRVKLHSVPEAEEFFGGRRYLFIVWPTKAYEDWIDEEDVGFSSETKMHEKVDIGLDSRFFEIAKDFGCVTIKLWRVNHDPEPVGLDEKSIHVLCDEVICDQGTRDEEKLWKKVARVAFRHATAVIAVDGPIEEGSGYEFERKYIAAHAWLEKKTILYKKGMNIGALKQRLADLLHAEKEELAVGATHAGSKVYLAPPPGQKPDYSNSAGP